MGDTMRMKLNMDTDMDMNTNTDPAAGPVGGGRDGRGGRASGCDGSRTGGLGDLLGDAERDAAGGAGTTNSAGQQAETLPLPQWRLDRLFGDHIDKAADPAAPDMGEWVRVRVTVRSLFLG